MTTQTTAQALLPELPEPFDCVLRSDNSVPDVYSANQMRSYALAAIEAAEAYRVKRAQEANDERMEEFEQAFRLIFDCYATPADNFSSDAVWAIWQHRKVTQAFSHMQKVGRFLTSAQQVDKTPTEPVANIYWDSSAEWKLEMLCEPNIEQGTRLPLVVAAGGWPKAAPPLYYSAQQVAPKEVPDGFNIEDLRDVAEALETAYESKINVGNVTGCGDEFLESTTAYAARFIRAYLSAAPTTSELPDGFRCADCGSCVLEPIPQPEKGA